MTTATAALSFDSIGRCLDSGWQAMRQTPGISIAYASVFGLIGAVIVTSLVRNGLTPFVLAAAGAFMLVGPVVLAGFFGIVRALEEKRRPSADDVFAGFHRPPAALWVIALVCSLLFIIFVTDAAILYSYMVGGTPVLPADMLPTPDHVQRFIVWATISGSVVALMIFAASAFSVPLICEGRATLVPAVVTSVRVVLANLAVTLVWAVLLSVLVMGSIILLPLFPVVMPVMAYASHALYREALPR